MCVCERERERKREREELVDTEREERNISWKTYSQTYRLTD